MAALTVQAGLPLKCWKTAPVHFAAMQAISYKYQLMVCVRQITVQPEESRYA